MKNRSGVAVAALDVGARCLLLPRLRLAQTGACQQQYSLAGKDADAPESNVTAVMIEECLLDSTSFEFSVYGMDVGTEVISNQS